MRRDRKRINQRDSITSEPEPRQRSSARILRRNGSELVLQEVQLDTWHGWASSADLGWRPCKLISSADVADGNRAAMHAASRANLESLLVAMMSLAHRG